MGSEIISIGTFIRDYGQFLITGVAAIWAYATLTQVVKEIRKDIEAHKTTHKDYCQAQAQELEELEERVGYRMTSMENSQSKLQELIYRQMETLATKIEGACNLINDVKSSQKETEGYLRAKKELEEKTPRHR